MKFDKLRLTGFKSFVEPTDLQIEPGLTGIVGPNGCGKSNLVEALRWVMGESSYKSMRASGMDDVIFSGSGGRPSRNMAEVGIVLDNASRSAPAAFNDSETIEITRRIEREVGSTYRLNGREVRARDVQLLFADASTGSRSPSMVRQGQIGEIISAKPQARRRILEEAAGVAGLHSRRHEAELRLKAAEDNIVRLDDVMKQIDAQAESLKRQARSATRYRNLAADIRRLEALVALIGHRDAQSALADSERRLEAEVRNVADRTLEQAEAARLQAIAAHESPPLRDAETRAGAALQRMVQARDILEADEKRARDRAAEIARRMEQIVRDLAREKALIADANDVVARLETEDAELANASAADVDVRAQAEMRSTQAAHALAETEKLLAEAQALLADGNAKRAALENALRDETGRQSRAQAELARVDAEFAQIGASRPAGDDIATLAEKLADATEQAKAAEDAAIEAEKRHAAAREAEAAARVPLSEADRKAQRLETEARTLTSLLAVGQGGLWPPVVDQISVAKGCEAALGAALGDDLDASTHESAPAHWALTEGGADASLPPGVSSLAELVTAPPHLARRLAQIGLVLREDGPRLRLMLKPGQRLVSREGDLWRWDGFTQGAEAPTPAARRLVEKNRLGDLTRESEAARKAAELLRAEAEAALAAVRAAASHENEARQHLRNARAAVETAREKLASTERAQAHSVTRLAALTEARTRLATNVAEAARGISAAETAINDLEAPAFLAGALDHARARAAEDRAMAAEARATLQSLMRDAEARQNRRATIEKDRRSWIERREKAADHVADFEMRASETEAEAKALADAPDEFLIMRRALLSEIATAEDNLREASDSRTQAEARLSAADRAARDAIEAMSATREARARTEAQVEAQRQRLADLVVAIDNDLQCAPHELSALAAVKPGDDLPAHADISGKLDQLKGDRERLGAVNLRADEELESVESQRGAMSTEREELTEAIRKLRSAIGTLNREGRERLLAAFDVVNGHFKGLFTTLFGGGSAELQLVESDDPLEAGLEILARPPGKKPQTMTLLSGGEQALTAMSLIFAVFLTNPSPICVLDEVDAPLDDSNVERFCALLEDMRGKTDTRFLVITHNPITMAHMDRLFGVTMAERGVSQLVSVDLQQAERFLEAS